MFTGHEKLENHHSKWTCQMNENNDLTWLLSISRKTKRKFGLKKLLYVGRLINLIFRVGS